MDKKQKTILLLIVIVAGYFIFFKGNAFLGTLADVTSATVKRTMPTSVKAGTEFSVTYTPQGMGTGSWGTDIDDKITCTSGTATPARITEAWTLGNKVFTVKASEAGTCNFVGTYWFGNTPSSKNLNDVSGAVTQVNVCVDTDGCPKSDWCDGNIAYTCKSNFDNDVCSESGIKDTCSGTCSNGLCVADCTTLFSNIFTAANAWKSSPDDFTKRKAVNDAITSWANTC